MSLKEIIIWPFAKFMIWLCEWTGSYGIAVILFALAVNLLLAYFMGKSKKSTMRTSRLQPRIQELQNRHSGNPQKLNEEMRKLYQEEGINPMSGCLWSLLPFPIIIILYSVIRLPLTRMMGLAEEAVNAIQDFAINNGWYAVASGKPDAYVEIKLANAVHEHWGDFVAMLTEKGFDVAQLVDINFKFLGMNLGDVPWDKFKLAFRGAEFKPSYILLFLVPLISAFLSWASMKVSSLSTPTTGDQQQAAQMKSMALMMPLMSIWICFIMPAAMGIYWIANSIIGMTRDYIQTKIIRKQLEIEDAERIAARSERERELELKRLETERLREEGKTVVNTSTSKKKIQANEKQKSDERKAAAEKAAKAEKRRRLGIVDEVKPASQVGDRRFARGRAYVADRFTNPDGAAEATLKAIEETQAYLAALSAGEAKPAENSTDIEAVAENTETE